MRVSSFLECGCQGVEYVNQAVGEVAQQSATASLATANEGSVL